MQKQELIILRTSPEIKRLVRALAKSNGLNMSSWIRHQIITEARRAGIVSSGHVDGDTQKREAIQESEIIASA